MLYDDLRKWIKTEIETCTGMTAYFNRATDTADRPYVSFDLIEAQMSELHRHAYMVSVDFWDMDDPKAIIEACSKLDKRWMQKKENKDTFVVMIYHGSMKEFVEDDDKRIRHLTRSYDMTAYSKEGE